jgi:large subunit ribosomal protein L15
MIKLENLHGDKGAKQSRKRVGRGESSGLGRTAGKGNKGEQARSGTPKGKGFEGGQTPLARRTPKRGFSHVNFIDKTVIVNLSQLNKFDNDAQVDFNALVQAGLIVRNTARVKVLGNGALEKKLTVSAHAFSKSAKEKIEALGGQCVLFKAPSPQAE